MTLVSLQASSPLPGGTYFWEAMERAEEEVEVLAVVEGPRKASVRALL